MTDMYDSEDKPCTEKCPECMTTKLYPGEPCPGCASHKAKCCDCDNVEKLIQGRDSRMRCYACNEWHNEN